MAVAGSAGWHCQADGPKVPTAHPKTPTIQPKNANLTAQKKPLSGWHRQNQNKEKVNQINGGA